MSVVFSSSCSRCPRLVAQRKYFAQTFPDYHAAPVAAFGDVAARLLIVGLAPGQHAANRTGVPFVEDPSGVFLYRSLYQAGFASSECLLDAQGRVNPELRLHDCLISNAVRCFPPQNKPTAQEVRQCNPYLQQELQRLPAYGVVLALGTVAHQAVLQALQLKKKDFPFAHGVAYDVSDTTRLVCSYHCSRYNVQTKRLTVAMFDRLMAEIKRSLYG